MTAKLLFLTFILFSPVLQAKDPFNFFLKREFNQTDEILGVGASAVIGSAHGLLKGEVVSSLNYAQVADDAGFMQDYLALDTGVRLGVYAQAFIYVEAGFDAFEFIWEDARDDDRYYYESLEHNSIDAYVGLGAGVDSDNIRVEGFVKARRIDSENWQSDHNIFYGVQLSLFF